MSSDRLEFRVPQGLLREVDYLVDLHYTSRSEIVRRAIVAYVHSDAQKRTRRRLTRQA